MCVMCVAIIKKRSWIWKQLGRSHELLEVEKGWCLCEGFLCYEKTTRPGNTYKRKFFIEVVVYIFRGSNSYHYRGDMAVWRQAWWWLNLNQKGTGSQQSVTLREVRAKEISNSALTVTCFFQWLYLLQQDHTCQPLARISHPNCHR